MIDFYLHWLNCLPYTDVRLKMAVIKSEISLKSLFVSNNETDVLRTLKPVNLNMFKPGAVKLFAKEVTDKVCRIKAESSYKTLMDKEIKAVSILDGEYPKRLTELFDPPIVLYFLGKLPEEDRLSIAVVGARKASLEGLKLSYEFSKEFASHNINVISGMALGIDAKAHQACVDLGVPTYAILGSGVDVPYPMMNLGLYEKTGAIGGIISEFPPGEKPLADHFPRRNRIISGLSDKVVLIEAGERSGSLITADFALEQGKDIYAVPGRPGDTVSRGCNELIKNGGAALVTTPFDVL
ncbi:MAG: DNA-processing protein DprA [Lachnospiraceae bacterium]|nr:DNA-processing protein DprA [Lachnospiraceae bacterium]